MPKPTIVIVEDELSILSMYETKLKFAGFNVGVARNGEEGLALIKQLSPDLVLLDIRMPVMSGDVMLQKLRETTWGSSIRIVILTNISKDEAPMSLRVLNVDRYIVKAHHTPSQVVSVVNEILKSDHKI